MGSLPLCRLTCGTPCVGVLAFTLLAPGAVAADCIQARLTRQLVGLLTGLLASGRARGLIPWLLCLRLACGRV